MTGKHTPGPWTISGVMHPENPERKNSDPGSVYISGPNWSDFCEVLVETSWGEDEKETEPDATGYANARLIRAAPELLAMVERLADEIDHMPPETNQVAAARRANVLSSARAVIKKATEP